MGVAGLTDIIFRRIPPCPGDLCPARFECSSARRAICHSLVEEYHTAVADEEDQQTQRHQVALLILCCSMFLVRNRELPIGTLCICHTD